MTEKRTKIVCTVGPASEAVSTLVRMMRAGMDVARLNFAHGTYARHRTLTRNIRAAARRVGKTVALLQDLQGPKIRVGELPKEGVKLTQSSLVVLSTAIETLPTPYSLHPTPKIPVQHRRLHTDVGKGDQILLDDGTIELRVERVRGRDIRCRVVLGGTLHSHKGINVPTAALSGRAVTAKDERDLAFGLARGVDFVALSFVRKPADVGVLRRLIKKYLPRSSRPPLVIVKVEMRAALERLDEIIAASDGIMVARGDLALEADAASVPIYQKTMIRKCLIAAKPVITATEMLGSMVSRPRPTRAELSDVANAVIDHTDATMLSGESATGTYPVKTVETMAHIIRDTEASPLDDLVQMLDVPPAAHPVLSVSAAACQVARDIGAKAILTVTTSGFTARAIARHRPPQPILALTADPVVARQIVLSWGVTPVVRKGVSDPARLRAGGMQYVRQHRLAKKGDRVVLVAGLRSDRAPRWEEAVRVIEF